MVCIIPAATAIAVRIIFMDFGLGITDPFLRRDSVRRDAAVKHSCFLFLLCAMA
jgi:hypothetical protein